MARFLKFLFVPFIVMSYHAASQDVALDKKLGAETAVQVEQEMGLYHHDSLQWLINRVGEKLVSRLKSNPFEYKFFLVDQKYLIRLRFREAMSI